MKRIFPAAFLCLPLIASMAFGQTPTANAPVLLTDAESLTGWSGDATLTEDAKEGKHAIAWKIDQDDAVVSLNYALGANRDRVANGKQLSFWYKFEGKGIKTFHLKLVAYPLAGGWQALYTMPIPAAGEWRRATVPLQEFEDQWGDKPDEKGGVLTFRIGTDTETDARLIVDHLQLIPLAPGEKANIGEKKVAEPVKPIIPSASPMALPAHPRLLLSRESVPAIRERIAKTDWAKTFYEGLKKRGDDWAGRTIEFPDRGGQWWHWYACPKHGTRLKMEGPTRHVCPTGGEVYSGYPYDDVVLSTKHDNLASATRDLGLLYQISGERRYADKAREILLGYAQRYLSYPLHNINGKPQVGGGRVLPQTLDESIWLISMAQGADAIWDTLSPADIEALKTKLFYPAAVDVIQKHKMSVHNIQCWKNSAVGLTGLLFGDPALVSDAVDSPSGYQVQMRDGVMEEGAWYEGAWGYHFYTMDAVRPLTEAAYHCGINLYGDAYKRMFLAPIVLAMPNMQLPAFNDSGKATAMGNANYEIALARYGDPRLVIPLVGSKRQSLQSLVSGVPTLPAPPADAQTSRNFPSSGYAILAAGTGADATWLCLKYGPHGGGHGHPDKNHFVLYSGGRILADDPGTGAYGVAIHDGWQKASLAHNTLVVDEANQRPSTGKCLDFQTKDGWSGAIVDAGGAIPGVTFRRATFLIGQNTVVFLDLIKTDDGKPRMLDNTYHPSGTWATAPAGSSVTPPQITGYSYLRDIKAVTTDAGFSGSIAAPSGPASSVAFAPGAATTYWAGTGVGQNTEDRVPIVIARRESASTAYLWSVGIGSDATPAVSPVAVTDAAGKAIAAHEAAAAMVRVGPRSYLVVANPGGTQIKAGSWTGSDKMVMIPILR